MPGGRFREAYYWDSYWVLLGLLAVGMRTTARNVVDNLLDAVEEHGFVPNGLRRYYLNRSQPPMLTQMVHAVAAALGCPSGPNADLQASHEPAPEQELELLQRALPLLDVEYRWWMREPLDGTASAVRLPATSGKVAAVLNRYVVNNTEPRPESWREDSATAAGLSGDAAARLYAELAAGAETGWDFSTRWLPQHAAAVSAAGATSSEGLSGAEPAAQAGVEDATPILQSIQTSELIAVDLNSILYKNEVSLSQLHARLATLLPPGTGSNESAAAAAYEAAAAERLRGMHDHLWNAVTGRWHDLLWRNGTMAPELSAAAFSPLWAGAHGREEAAAALASLNTSGLLQVGGVATTLEASGQQWDFPNAWPPLQA